MGSKGGKAPKTPDYTSLAEQNQLSNWNAAIDNFRLSNPDVYNQYGRVDYEIDPATGQTMVGTELSPEQQQLYDRDLSQNLSWQDRQDQAWGRYGDVLAGAGAGRDAVQDALYRRSTAMLDPQYSQRGSDLESKLANEGVFRGSELYNREMGNFGRERDAAYADARDRAIMAGGSEESRIQDQAGQNLNLIESMYRYQNPLQAGGVTGSNVQGADYLGAANQQFQGDLNKYNAGQAANQNFMNSIMSLGGSLGSAAILAPALSDIRVKTGIHQIGQTRSGLGIYKYHYIWGGPEQIGVMAQEVLAKQPSAVVQGDILRVDYSKLEV